MKLTSVTPMLWVSDVRATIDYYVRTLQFGEANYVKEWDWGVVERDGVSIMLAKPNQHEPFQASQFTGSLYIRTDDVDGWWEMLKEKVEILYSPETFDWGMKEFAIRDCNGFILQFGEDKSKEKK